MFMVGSSVWVHSRLSMSVQPPIANFPDNPVVCDGIDPMTQDVQAWWRWGSQTPRGVLKFVKCIKYQTGQIGVGPHKNFKKVGTFDIEWLFNDMNEECNMPGTVKNLFY